jgi:hypothetical protein
MKSSGCTLTEMGRGPFSCGVGNIVAVGHLNKRLQNPHTSVVRTLVHIAEAMEKSRKKYPKWIGRPADYIVLREDKVIMRFPAESPLLGEWLKMFKKKDTLEMDKDPSFRKAFEDALYPHVSKNR